MFFSISDILATALAVYRAADNVKRNKRRVHRLAERVRLAADLLNQIEDFGRQDLVPHIDSVGRIIVNIRDLFTSLNGKQAFLKQLVCHRDIDVELR